MPTNRNRLQVHPFTPIPLDLCRKSILSFWELDTSLNEDLRVIKDAFSYLENVNTMCQSDSELNTDNIMDLEAPARWIT